MKFSFCVLSNGSSNDLLQKHYDSILNQKNMPDDCFEIITIGGCPNLMPDCKNHVHIPFDENYKKGWITAIKNIFPKVSKFDNLSISHDYIYYHPDWYDGFVKWGDDQWDVCMVKIANKDGVRFRDWVEWNTSAVDKVSFLDYDRNDITNRMYISGSYYLIKKQFAIEHPLDERLVHMKSEDVAFSLMNRHAWRYKMNQNSVVQFLRQKDPYPISNQIICPKLEI